MFAATGLPEEPASALVNAETGFVTAAFVSDTATPASDFTYTSSNGQVTITKYTGLGSVVNIPSVIDGLPVISIGTRAFVNRDNLTSITIPDGVISIGDYAFNACTRLTSITIPDGVISVGGGAFYGCTTLTSVTIPGSVTSIGDFAFYVCSSLTSITVDSTNAIYSSINGVLYDKAIETLIRCPGSMPGVITIPASVTSIEHDAFHGCSSLTSITIPDGVISIGDYAFNACTRLTSITIPDDVTSIGRWAFLSCTSLTSVTIPGSVTRIGDLAFGSCTSLTSITVDSSNAVYSSINGLLYDKAIETLICCPGGKSEVLAIPDSVTSIRRNAFSDCTTLRSITIPGGVTSIGDYSFSGCTSLTSITVDSSNAVYSSINGLLYDKAIETLICCPGGKSQVLTIPGSVTSIRSNAFYRCTTLTSVTIPDGVTGIGNRAFYGCTTLTSVTIPDSVTIIGAFAFYDCTSLTSVTIPGSVNSIETYAFSDCTSLTSIFFCGGAPQVRSFAFANADKATAYFVPGSQGWTEAIGGIPTKAATSPLTLGSVIAVRGNTEAGLSWSTPTFNGGNPISDYAIQYRSNKSEAWMTFSHTISANTAIAVTGLTNGTSYVFRVAAVNAVGQGAWSSPSNPVTPLPTPAAPTRPVGTSGNGAVSLTWTAPRVTGGLRITDYVIQYSSNAGLKWTTAADSVSTATRVTVGGLTNGVSYVFRIAAVTAGGQGAFSANSASRMPYSRTATPAAPTNVIGLGSSGTVSLSWTASLANAGGPVSGYLIQYRRDLPGSAWTTLTYAGFSGNSATIRRLAAGRGYVFRVAAKNLAGQGSFSTVTSTVTA